MKRFASWNVNGIRACINKDCFHPALQTMDADIIGLQEVKAMPEQVNLEAKGYHQFWNSAQRKGYSGTLVLSREKPLQVKLGMGLPEHDTEGRVIAVEYADFWWVTVYTPNSKQELARLDYRTQQWDVLFLNYMKELEQDKPVIFCGDLNVAHKEIDLANPNSNRRNAGFTDEERHRFDCIVDAGFIDTFREFYQDGGHYTWWKWSRGNMLRTRNVGWRIDYFCISAKLRPRLVSASIRADIMGSDHCPVLIEMDI